MSLDCGRKPDYPEKTHVPKKHANSAQKGQSHGKAAPLTLKIRFKYILLQILPKDNITKQNSTGPNLVTGNRILDVI